MTHWRAQLPLGTGTWTSLGFAQSSRTTVSRSSARVDLSKKPACVFEFIRLSPQTSPSGSCETNETRFPPRPTRFPLRLQRLPVGPLPSAPRRSATLRRPLRSRYGSPPPLRSTLIPDTAAKARASRFNRALPVAAQPERNGHSQKCSFAPIVDACLLSINSCPICGTIKSHLRAICRGLR